MIAPYYMEAFAPQRANVPWKSYKDVKMLFLWKSDPYIGYKSRRSCHESNVCETKSTQVAKLVKKEYVEKVTEPSAQVFAKQITKPTTDNFVKRLAKHVPASWPSRHYFVIGALIKQLKAGTQPKRTKMPPDIIQSPLTLLKYRKADITSKEQNNAF